MGREIRKVPKGWQHPKDSSGKYIPMFVEAYSEVLREWKHNNRLWEAGKHPDQTNYPENTRNCSYADWAGEMPQKKHYNPTEWSETEAICYQMYENVSEGTPVSPVFDKLVDLEDWLVKTQGYDRLEAKAFCKEGYAPTFSGKIPIDSPLMASTRTGIQYKFNHSSAKAKKRKKTRF